MKGVRETPAERLCTWLSAIGLAAMAFIMLYPFWYLLIYSLNEPMDAMRGGFYWLPRKFSLTAFANVWAVQNIPQATLMSALRTTVGTVAGVLACGMVGFVLSRPQLVFRRFFTLFFLVTMYVGGGLIPWYMVIKWTGLTNTFLAYIVPGLVNVFNMLIMKTYFQEMPEELWESAEIDGANDLQIFFRLVLPLARPVVAVVAIFTAVGHWNSWFDNWVLTAGNKSLETLQLILMNMLKQASVTRPDTALMTSGAMRMTQQSVRAAITVIATLPIVFVYPFFQRHFLQGILMGSLKM